jgi:hypothetical protein
MPFDSTDPFSVDRWLTSPDRPITRITVHVPLRRPAPPEDDEAGAASDGGIDDWIVPGQGGGSARISPLPQVPSLSLDNAPAPDFPDLFPPALMPPFAPPSPLPHTMAPFAPTRPMMPVAPYASMHPVAPLLSAAAMGRAAWQPPVFLVRSEGVPDLEGLPAPPFPFLPALSPPAQTEPAADRDYAAKGLLGRTLDLFTGGPTSGPTMVKEVVPGALISEHVNGEDDTGQPTFQHPETGETLFFDPAKNIVQWDPAAKSFRFHERAEITRPFGIGDFAVPRIVNAIAQSALSGVRLPGDVVTGRADPRFGPLLERTSDLASLLVLGSTGNPGAVSRTRIDFPNVKNPIDLREVKRRLLAANVKAGKEWEEIVRSELERSGLEFAEHVTIVTSNGHRTRVDFVTRDPKTGEIRLIEAKASQRAGLRRNQPIAHDDIFKSGGVIVGKGKPGFPGGTRIPRGEVTIRTGP